MDSTIYVGGAVFRAGLGSVPGWGIRVEGERIKSVLPDEVLRRQADSGARIVELDGAFLSPAFTDAHLHPVAGGVDAARCDLSDGTDLEAYLKLIADYAGAHPERPWILGGGWSMDAFPGGTPRKEDLDAVVGDRPVALANRDRHGFWVNSVALERGGVDAGTLDPPSGRIERDPDGTPTGTLHEGAADLVLRYQPEATRDEQVAGLLAAQEMCFSHGIAGWQDAIVGASSVGPDHLDAYLAASSDGSLKARASLALWWDRDRGLEQIDELIARRALVARSAGRLRADSVKIMVDGVAENFSAAVSSSYLDQHGHPTGGLGLAHFDAEQLKKIVRELDLNGFQAHFHALGDRAVTFALDAIENALRANGPSDNRHHLAHLQMIRIEDVPRFVSLDATATIQALWAQPEPQMCELTLPFLDPGLRSRQYPFHDLLAAGARLAGGSDWPVSTAYPLEAMQIAVTRLDPENPAAPALLPEQAIPLERIWTAYTAGSAWVCHRESEAGSLDPGKLADLAILDRNPFEIDPMELSGVRVLSTVVGGEEVHTA